LGHRSQADDALYCAVGPDFLMKVIESGSHRWKPQHFQLMKKQ
jgi:hypothetical protein